MTRTSLRRLSGLPLLAGLLVGAPALAQDGQAPQEPPRQDPQRKNGELDTARALGRAFTRVAKEALPAVVHIEVVRELDADDPARSFEEELFRRFFPHRRGPGGQELPFRQRGEGSGFIISPDGLILTNHHVVGEADTIRVKLPDGRTFTGKKVGTDPQTDVAVIRLEDAPRGETLPHLPLGTSAALEVGEWVIAVGNPFGLNQTVTAGIVSATGRTQMGLIDYEDFIQTDAAINPGNSGGPLLNIEGEVVGLNTAIVTRTGGYQGIGFAIPIDLARRIQEQLVASGAVTRGYLGVMIQDLTPELAGALGLDEATGVLVADVSPGSPAAEAGIQTGDVLTHLDGAPIEGVGPLRNQVSLMQPGERLELRLRRGGEEQTLELAVGELPTTATAEAEEEEAPAERSFGLAVSELAPQQAEQLGYEAGAAGVLIRAIEPGSPAEEAGLQPGMIVSRIGAQAIETPEDFVQAIQRGYEQGQALLLVRTPEGSRFVLLQRSDEPS